MCPKYIFRLCVRTKFEFKPRIYLFRSRITKCQETENHTTKNLNFLELCQLTLQSKFWNFRRGRSNFIPHSVVRWFITPTSDLICLFPALIFLFHTQKNDYLHYSSFCMWFPSSPPSRWYDAYGDTQGGRRWCFSCLYYGKGIYSQNWSKHVDLTLFLN